MKVKRIINIALFTTITCIFSVVNFYIFEIPVTLQTMMVILTALFLSPIDAFLSVVVYIIIGLLGLPVFSGFKSGPGVLFGPTGGFILSFPIAAFLISYFKGNKSLPRLIIISLLFGVVLVYLIGSLQLSFYNKVNFFITLKTMIIFIPFDLIKILISILTFNRLKELEFYEKT